jgi:hypothetical protein
MVSRVIDSRTVLLRHANWSPINGVRGQTENDVRAVDVSDANDWSAVRVWYAPIQDLGTTHWPVDGFIYNRPAHAPPDRAASEPAPRCASPVPPHRCPAPDADGQAPPAAAARQPIGADFLNGVAAKPSPPKRP